MNLDKLLADVLTSLGQRE